MKWDTQKIWASTVTWLTGDAAAATRQFWLLDMRWSYLMVSGLAFVGVVVNFFLPHGWTVWPFVMAAAILLFVHEAAERNGQGVPPLHVYALFFGALAAWIIVMAILSVTNPLIVVLGIAILGYRCAKAWIKQRERNRIIEERRAAGQCIYCGEIVENANLGVCMNCGNDPDPSATQLARVASIVHGAKQTERARAVIKGESLGQIASKKERVLAASRPRKSSARRK